MDEKLLEFWGNFLLNASRGKRQVSDMFHWMEECLDSLNNPSKLGEFPGIDHFTKVFKQFYGLDKINEQSAEYRNITRKAAKDFQKSFADYLSFLGLVPKKDFLALVEKYEKLKRKCSDQEESIKHLRMLLDARDESAGASPGDFQDYMKEQGEFVKKFFDDFGWFMRYGEDKKKQEENDGSGSGSNAADPET